MPVHDWTRVDAGIFHAFHVAWIPEIGKVLNGGLLPEGYYALPEQHTGRAIADILTLHASPALVEPLPLPPATGGTLVAEAPPRVSRRQTIEPAALAARRRTLAVRHVSGHRLVALLEILSPANKDRLESVQDFVTKAVAALDAGVHLLLVDLFPPGASALDGMPGVIRRRLEQSDEPYDLPKDRPLTLARYAAGPRIDVAIEHLAVGSLLCDMPLYLRPDRYVEVPLEATYQAAYAGMPAFWRHVLEGQE
jgi:hypothetical protein